MKLVSTHILSLLMFASVPSWVRMQYSYMPLPPSNMVRIPFGNPDETTGNTQSGYDGIQVQESYPTFPQITQLGLKHERTAKGLVSQNPFEMGFSEQEPLSVHSYQPGYTDQQYQTSMSAYQPQSSPQETPQPQTRSVQLFSPNRDTYNSGKGLFKGVTEPLQRRAVELAPEYPPLSGSSALQQPAPFDAALWDQPKAVQYGLQLGERQARRFLGQSFPSSIYEEPKQSIQKTPPQEPPFGGHQGSALYREQESRGYGIEQIPGPKDREESQFGGHLGPSFDAKLGYQPSRQFDAPLLLEQRTSNISQQPPPFGVQRSPVTGRNLQPLSNVGGQQTFQFSGYQGPSFEAQLGYQPSRQFDDPSRLDQQPSSISQRSALFGGPHSLFGRKLEPQPDIQMDHQLEGQQNTQFGGHQVPNSFGRQQRPSLEPQDGPRAQTSLFNGQALLLNRQRVLQKTAAYGFQGGPRAQTLPTFDAQQGSSFERYQDPKYREQQSIPPFEFQAGSRPQVLQLNEQGPFDGQRSSQYKENPVPLFGLQGRSPNENSYQFGMKRNPQFGQLQDSFQEGTSSQDVQSFDRQRLPSNGQQISLYGQQQMPSLGYQDRSRAQESITFGIPQEPQFGLSRDTFQTSPSPQKVPEFENKLISTYGERHAEQNGEYQMPSLGYQDGNRAQESSQFGTQQGPQFGQQWDMLNRVHPTQQNEQQWGLQSRTYEEPYVAKQFGSQWEEPQKKSLYKPSQMGYSELQGTSTGAQRGVQFTPPLEQSFGQQQDSWMVQPQNAQTRRDQLGFQRGQIGSQLLNQQTTLSTDIPSNFRLTPIPDSTNRGFPLVFEQANSVGARQLQQELFSPAIEKATRSSLWSSGDILRKLQLTPLGKPSPIFQPTESQSPSDSTSRKINQDQEFQNDNSLLPSGARLFDGNKVRTALPSIFPFQVGRGANKGEIVQAGTINQDQEFQNDNSSLPSGARRLPWYQRIPLPFLLPFQAGIRSINGEIVQAGTINQDQEFQNDNTLLPSGARLLDSNKGEIVTPSIVPFQAGRGANKGEIVQAGTINQDQEFQNDNSLLPSGARLLDSNKGEIVSPSIAPFQAGRGSNRYSTIQSPVIMSAPENEQPFRENQNQPIVWTPDSEQEASGKRQLDQLSKLEYGQMTSPQSSWSDRLHSTEDHQPRTSMSPFQVTNRQLIPTNRIPELQQEQQEWLKEEKSQQEISQLEPHRQQPWVDQQEPSVARYAEVTAGQRKESVHEASGARSFTQTDLTTEPPKQKVRLQIFFESLCPDSRRFFGTQLKPMMDKIGDYIQLELHPYGKAKINQTTGEIRCQHGQNECSGNLVDSCAIERLKNGIDQANFVECMFENSKIPLPVAGQYCSGQNKLDWTNDIEVCYQGPEGLALHHKHGATTMQFIPNIEWVPYIILNNNQGDEDYQKILTNYLLQETCAELTKLNNRPPEC